MKIRYYGHVGVPTGYGDAAAEMCMAIAGAGHDLEISTDGDNCHRRFLPLVRCFKNEAALTPPDVVVVHSLPLDCAKILSSRHIREQYPKALCVAYTTWEGASWVPESLVVAFSMFDQIWVPSFQNKATICHPRLDGIPVEVVPHAFDESRWAEAASRSPPAPPARPYRFYYIGAWTARKNVDGLIRAYLRAFRAGEEVELILQSAGAGDSALEVSALSTGLVGEGSAPTMPTIRFSNRRMSHEEIMALHRESHCFVTATRGEAWNLPAFDAMLAGRHIIAPKGQGSDDFLEGTSATLYGSRLAPAFGDVLLVDAPNVPAGHAVAHYVATQGLTARCEWRDPDLVDLALRMRGAFGVTDTLWVPYDPRERYGRAAVGQRITQILKGASR